MLLRVVKLFVIVAAFTALQVRVRVVVLKSDDRYYCVSIVLLSVVKCTHYLFSLWLQNSFDYLKMKFAGLYILFTE